MAKRISITTGAEKYEIVNENGTVIGWFEINPTDINIAKRFDTVRKFFDEYDYESLKEGDDEDLSKVIKFSDEIAEQLDYMFGYKVSNSLFSFCSPLAKVDNDTYYFEHVIKMLETIVSDGAKERAEAKSERIAEATEGY